jgi:predicted PurR-regulated permease PerM
MSEADPSRERFRKSFLLLLTLGISVLFLAVIRGFLMSVLLAAIFAGMAHPLYKWVLPRLGGRPAWASAATMVILLTVIGLPLIAFLTIVAGQALELSEAAGPWIQRQTSGAGDWKGRLDSITVLENYPFLQRLLPESEVLLSRAAEAVSGAGAFLVGSLAGITRGTLSFVLHLFVMLYAMFFFLMDGPSLLGRILYYSPLTSEDEERLVARFVSVARATLKGSFLIGILQGFVAGVGFLVAGVPGAAFWGTVMVVAAMIPLVGAGLVWVPAVLYLMVAGHVVPALGLLAWCALVVSTVDNILRPRLVGRDIRISDLLILLSTLGGIAFFGVPGVVVGPIVAALFVTVWHLYGEAFRDWLPGRAPPEGLRPSSERAASPSAEV